MKTILILGATSDIAWACARKFASEGNNIILAARNIEALKPMISDLNIRYNIKSYGVSFEVNDFANHDFFYENLPHPPDCVACFFGYLGNQDFENVTWDEVYKSINTNYSGAVSILNIAVKSMLKTGNNGSIIGVSSVAGDRGRMSNFIYGSAKAGFTTYLSGLRNFCYHHNINVLTVKPGFVATKMTENLKLPKLLTATTEAVATDIYNGWIKNKNIIYTKWFWRYIMLIINCIPEFLFKKFKL